ncbi:unnamed protein product [Rhizophagus irregularis]|nr:unnamed protein product [Rhizophagus irregularis]
MIIVTSKSHITPGKLVATGSIVPELHYGPYLRDWWIFSKETAQNKHYPIPLRLGLEVMIQLNNNPFIIRIVRNVHSFLQPGYICEGRGQSSGISTSASAAITSVYQSIFGSKTKYAGLSYLGLDQPETAQKLLEGITFRPFIIELENITVFVSCLGKITISNTNKVGHNYVASLFHKYRRVQSVFYQHIDKNFFVITIYQNSQIVAEYKDISPNAVWNKTGNKFWTNVPDPEKDRKTIAKLYKEGLLNVNSQADTLWNCFHNSYNANSKGIDGKMRILSIIAENFTYKEIIEQLEVSPNSIKQT